MTRIAYVSTYVPKQCGLATYTHHLCQSVHSLGPRPDSQVIAVVDDGEEIECYDPSVYLLRRNVRQQYGQMADWVNRAEISLVSLQHEFGIFGGTAGEYILDFVRGLRKPLVTTFHTVFSSPREPYRAIQAELAESSERIIVMNRRAVDYLHDSFHVDRRKIVYIPHGTPSPTSESRTLLRQQLGWSGRKVVMTFGLINRGKGIELVLEALPAILEKVPNVLYAVVGTTHPEVKRREGEAYRSFLLDRVHKLHLDHHVTLVNQYLSETELAQYITASDLFVTPYPGMDQITSGTLAYAVGLGRPVLSTPYAYARDLLSEWHELLIPFGDAAGWSEAMSRVIADDLNLALWEQRMAAIGQAMHWPQVGGSHAHLFESLLVREKSMHEGGDPVVAASR